MKFGLTSHRYALIAVVLFATGFGHVVAADCDPGPVGTAGPWIDGSDQSCSDFRTILVNLGIFGALEYDSTDEGWVYVNLTNPGEPRYQSVSGLCESSQVAHNDNTANHDSHDHGTDITVDAQYLNLLSNVNGPNNEDSADGIDSLCDPTTIELEWEIGTFPGEHGATVQQRTFPKWAWPNVGDRVWTNGSWIFDCGHAKKICLRRDPDFHICLDERSYFHSEIHPPRAIASMRNQAATLPSSGTTPVPVTATDLYIHGRAGMVGDVLQCGMPVVLGGGSCSTSAYPHRGFAINEDFDFDICLPVRPTADARLEWVVAGGPANSVPLSVEPQITRSDAPLPECANADAPMDGATTLHVHIPLGGQNVGPDEVYARRITAGWIDPPDPTLKHLNVSLDRIDLHDSKDNDELLNPLCGEDGELSFFWASLDRAPNNAWIRLADYAPVDSSGNSVLNDYGPNLLGHSFVDLPGATWDFYVRQGQPLNLRGRGFEQDCYDQFFGEHTLNVFTPYAYCFASPTTCRDNNNEELDKLDAQLAAPDYGGIDPATGVVTLHPASPPKDRFIFGHNPPIVSVSDYAFDVTVRRVPQGLEDTSDLAISKSCSPDSGTSFLCSFRVSNPGPGLPRNVVVDDVITASAGPASFTVGTPTATRSDGSSFDPNPCSITGPGHVRCAIGTIPVGGYVTIAIRITSSALGDYDDVATVATDSTDPTSGNNQATGGWTVVPVDIKPGSFPNAINVTQSGSDAVAILQAGGFNPAVVNPASVCFGDAEDPPARTCQEVHNTGHRVDADKDRDIDLILHYEIRRTGIDVGDTSACLTGTTFAGRTIVGCDSVKAK